MWPAESHFLVLVAISSLDGDSRMAENEALEVSTRTCVVTASRCSLSPIRRCVDISVDALLAAPIRIILTGKSAGYRQLIGPSRHAAL